MTKARNGLPTNEPVVLVTGGAQGIGKGIARYLLQEGWQVVVADRDGEAGEEAEAELREVGLARFVATDVADEGSVRDAVAAAIEPFGRLDALFNNAGVADPVNGPVEALDRTEWDRRLAPNLTGAFLCTKHAVPRLKTSSGGAIVNIASTRTYQSEPHTEAYAATKGGLAALTHALAVSLGPVVRVNVVCPGWVAVSDVQKTAERAPPGLRPVDHAQHPAGRVGRPRDGAALVVYLPAEEAGFVTGQSFVVDGGMMRRMQYAR